MAVNTVLTVTLLCLGVIQIKAFSTGAPEGVCDDLTPQHNTEAQKTPFPYTVKVSTPNIRPGDKVQVTITGKKGSTFKGFIIQARDGDKSFGTFDEASKVKVINCHNGKKNAATHTDADPKRSIELTWTAPAKISGKTTYVFTTTVARDGGTYWVAQKGAQVTVSP